MFAAIKKISRAARHYLQNASMSSAEEKSQGWELSVQQDAIMETVGDAGCRFRYQALQTIDGSIDGQCMPVRSKTSCRMMEQERCTYNKNKSKIFPQSAQCCLLIILC